MKLLLLIHQFVSSAQDQRGTLEATKLIKLFIAQSHLLKVSYKSWPIYPISWLNLVSNLFLYMSPFELF